RRRSGERIRAARGLRKGDDLAEGRLAGEQGDEALDPEREASVRRRAHLERLEEPAELRLRFLVGHPHGAEDAFLNLLAVDPDRAGAELPAVPDQVVVLAERRAGIRLDQILVSVD